MTPYDHPDYHALIRTIREIDRHPTDNDSTLARLVTADWLEERGEEGRAGYIRAACEDAHGLQYSSSLLAIQEYRRFGEIPATRPEEPGTSGVVRDGFLRWLSCPLAWWLEHGPAVVLRHPVREVVIRDRTPHAGGIGFMWFAERVGDPWPGEVPSCLLTADMWDGHPTAASARAALNAAALRWAESSPVLN